MTINAQMLETKLAGIVRDIDTTITGTYKRDEKGKPILDKDGKKVPLFPTMPLRFKLDYTDAMLAQALALADSSATIRIQNQYRKISADAVEKIQGTTFKVVDLLVRTTAKLPPQVHIERNFEKLTDAEKLVMIEKMKASMGK